MVSSDSEDEDDNQQPFVFPPDDGEEEEAPVVEEGNDDELNRQRAVHSIDHAILLDKKYFVDFTLFMTALQDPGCVDPQSKQKRRIHFPQLHQAGVAFRMFDKLKAGKYPDLPTKKTRRVSKELVHAILKERSLVGIHEVDQAFKVFGSKGMVYFIHNNEQFFGYNKEFHFHLVRRGKVKADMRTPSDAVRLAAVMLHKDHFRAVEIELVVGRHQLLNSKPQLFPVGTKEERSQPKSQTGMSMLPGREELISSLRRQLSITNNRSCLLLHHHHHPSLPPENFFKSWLNKLTRGRNWQNWPPRSCHHPLKEQ